MVKRLKIKYNMRYFQIPALILLIIIYKSSYAQEETRALKFFALTGFNSSTLNFQSDTYAYITNPNKSLSYNSIVFGGGFIALEDPGKSGLRLLLDLQVSRFTMSDTSIEVQSATQTRYESISIKYTRIKLSFGPRYYFSGSNFIPMVGAGISFNLYKFGNADLYQYRDYANIPDLTVNQEGKLSGFSIPQLYLSVGFKAKLAPKLRVLVEGRADLLGNKTNSLVKFDGADLIQQRSIKTKSFSIFCAFIFPKRV